MEEGRVLEPIFDGLREMLTLWSELTRTKKSLEAVCIDCITNLLHGKFPLPGGTGVASPAKHSRFRIATWAPVSGSVQVLWLTAV